MKASHAWLREFVPIAATPVEMRDLFTAHTATVEELEPLRADLAPIVVARVVEARRHPDSDHLWATRVDAGGAELLDVVCGAPNVTAGKSYPFAPTGTTMPNGMKIERRKIRGVVSNGMLCSARELGLGEEHDGILQLDTTAAPGTPFLEALPVGDTRLVFDVGANRPDLLSHLGLARELAAISGTPWRLPELPVPAAAIPASTSVAESGTVGGVRVTVERDTRTRRYIGAVVKGVQVGPSPSWLVQRLEAVGVRAINNVVDATNYVLHELGQPVHAFDLAKLGGAVSVRAARKGESLTTLDGVTRALPAQAVVIAGGDAAHAIAGVMGGRDSEVTNDTRDLFIEVASFDPALTRRARKAVGLGTDASYRFERGVDPHLAPIAVERILRLVLGLAGGTLSGAPLDVMSELPTRSPVPIRLKRVAQVLGAELSAGDVQRYLAAAGFEVTRTDAQGFDVNIPTWRSDVAEEIDLVEEVARFHGYDRFPLDIRPYRPSTTTDDALWTVAQRLRDVLVGAGLLETRPMPFVHGADDTHVRVANPLSENEAYLRTSVLDTLSRRAEFNLAHRSGDVRVFEIGSVFLPRGASAPREELRVGIVVMGRRHPSHFSEPQPPAFDEWDAKWLAERAAGALHPGTPVALHPGADADLWTISAGSETIGRVTRLALDAPVWASPAYGIEIVVGEMASAPPAGRGAHVYDRPPAFRAPAVSRYRALPSTPAAEFDLALLVPNDTTAARVEESIRSAAGELLEHLELFDQYTGEGVAEHHRSLAWRLTFRHPERTLRDKEIEGRRSKILAALEQELHVRQRTS